MTFTALYYEVTGPDFNLHCKIYPYLGRTKVFYSSCGKKSIEWIETLIYAYVIIADEERIFDKFTPCYAKEYFAHISHFMTFFKKFTDSEQKVCILCIAPPQLKIKR